MFTFLPLILAITHEIYKSFEGFEVRGVLLDISKAFYKVWHEGLLVKLNQKSISGNLLKLLRDFLSCRKQRVASTHLGIMLPQEFHSVLSQGSYYFLFT